MLQADLAAVKEIKNVEHAILTVSGGAAFSAEVQATATEVAAVLNLVSPDQVKNYLDF